MEDDKKLQEEFIQFLAQQLGAKTEQDLTQKVKKLGKEGVKKYYDAFVQYKQKQAKKAAHGTKLTYFKHLKNQCPEGEEIVYYKVGGRVGCGCKKIKKAEEGTEVNPIDKFKKAVKSAVTTQIPKQKPKQRNNDIIIKKENKKYADDVDHNGFLKTKAFGRVNVTKLTKNQMKKLTPEEKESIDAYASDEHIPSEEKGSKIKKNCGGVKLAKKGEKVCPKCGKVHSAGMGCTVANFKRHYQGGNLNRIFFKN